MSSCPDGSDIFSDIVICKWSWNISCDSLESQISLLQRLLFELYLIVLPVFIQIHWEMGKLDFFFLAKNCLIFSLVRRHSKEQSRAHTTMAEKQRESKITSLNFYFPLKKSPNRHEDNHSLIKATTDVMWLTGNSKIFLEVFAFNQVSIYLIAWVSGVFWLEMFILPFNKAWCL